MRVSFFFLCAGDRDLERLDREELRRPLELPAGDRDLDLRRPDEELLGQPKFIAQKKMVANVKLNIALHSDLLLSLATKKG